MAADTPQDSPAGESSDADFQAPHPGSPEMPRWDTNQLRDAPRFTWRNWFSMLGPGLVLGGAAIGGGEWLLGPLVTAKYGGALLWLATVSILGQVIYNIEISRYTLYSGEPIFTGKFRTLPGPMFWLPIYLLLDFGMVFPYLAANAATPLATVINGGVVPDPKNDVGDFWLMKLLAYAIFICALIPLLFGGKIYNSLRAVMSFKLVVVLGFLLVLAVFYSSGSSWAEIVSGFFKFGNVPVERGEDANGNGQLDPGEDWDSDGHLDVVEPKLPDLEELIADGKPWPDLTGDGNPNAPQDSDGDGEFDTWGDLDGDGEPEPFDAEATFIDYDRDGFRDGNNVANVFTSVAGGGGLPDIDFTLIAFIAGLAAIAGSGGLSNTPISNYTRDQGWGMGYHVGAIPSVVGGHNIQLSHVGAVFDPNEDSLPRWKRWYKHVVRDQLAVWMPACFIGLALPSMLSIEYLRRGYEADNWTAAAMTAGGVQERVTSESGAMLGSFFWFMTLFCGFMVLAPSMATSADGLIRRWVDVFWTSSRRLRKLDPKMIKKVYFWVLTGYATFGLIMLALPPSDLISYATMFFNIALGFSCWHTLALNLILLPPQLRPNWFVRIALSLAGLFFFTLGVITILKTTGLLEKITG